MFSFVIKKMFFDMWDNLIVIILLNIGLLLFLGLLLLPLSFIAQFDPIIIFLYLVIALLLFNQLLGITAGYTKDISDFKKPGFRDFFSYIKISWKNSIISSLFLILIIAIILFVLPYYFFRGTIIDLILCGIVFWTTFTLILASMYFIPISLRINKSIKKNIRNSFLLLFDNTAFSIFMFLVSILLFGISFFTVFMVPGLATLTLWVNVCIKIRLYKYDYLEAHPDTNRKAIPWKELILEDEKKVGKRTLRGMIFPWKE